MLTISSSKKTFLRYTPFLSILLAIWADQIFLRPFGVSGPLIAGICIYYWAVYRPYALSAIGLVILGFYQDLLMGTPLGISTTLYIVLSVFIFYQRHALILSSFLTIWAGFAVFASLLQTLLWAMLCVLNKCYIPITKPAYTVAFAVLVYPFLMRALIYLHNAEET